MTKLALLRHGHTAWNREGRIQGRTDIPLDQQAEWDLSALCFPDPWGAAQLVASPLTRAQATATLVGRKEPTTEPTLIEMDWGDWEGQHAQSLHDDPKADHRPIEDWGWDYAPPGGERLADVRARLEPWLANLEGNTVAVTHIGVMRVLLALAWGWNFDSPCPFGIKRNRLYVIERVGTAWRAWSDPIKLLQRTS